MKFRPDVLVSVVLEAQRGIVDGVRLKFFLDPHLDSVPRAQSVHPEFTINEGPYRLRPEFTVNQAIIKHEDKIVTWMKALNLKRLNRGQEETRALLSLLIQEWKRVQGIKALEWKRQSREPPPSRDLIQVSTCKFLLLSNYFF